MTLLEFLLGLLGRRPRPAPPTPPTPMPTPEGNPLDAVNAGRSGAGLAPLRLDPGLQGIAASWASHMAATGVLTHGDFLARVASVHPGAPAAENVAEGQSSASQVVADWMTSARHRANMLGNYDSAGLASATGPTGTYWALVLAKLGR